MSAPKMLEVKSAHVSASVVACLEQLLEEIKSGVVPAPEKIIIVSAQRKIDKTFSVELRGAASNTFDVFGMLEVAKLQLYEHLGKM